MNATPDNKRGNPRFSIIIPARNEEGYIDACIEAVERAAERVSGGVEIIVGLNRCNDRTEEIALAHGAKIVREDAKNISKIRNETAKAATGDILVFLDADSNISEGLLAEIEKRLTTGKIVGGGTLFKLDRTSLGIFITTGIFHIGARILNIMGGPYWLFREDYWAVGGFNEDFIVAEDTEFARRLKKLGRARGQKFSVIRNEHVITSARKFDQLGDWYVLLHPWHVVSSLRGGDRKVADKIWYDIER